MKTRMIHNPTAGPWDVRRGLGRVCKSLTDRGWSVDIQETEKPGDGIVLARTAAREGYDAVIVAGGDGTINEAVNGLAGTQTALGVLPVGTGNMWAKQLGVPTYTLAHPMRLREAVASLAEGTVRLVDLGQVSDRYFLCWAGIGLDAQVTTEMEPRTRQTKRLGALPYAIAIVLVAREFKGVRTQVTIDGSIVRGRTLLVLVSNIRQYIGRLNVAPRARLDDGLLDVFVFKGLGFPYAMRHLIKIVSQRYLQDPKVVHRQAREIEVTTEWATPVQVDGDPIGTTPVRLQVVPRALRVVVPPGAPPDLFTATSSA
jgi:YegS/Rv2252/BmrU family lipid kinase